VVELFKNANGFALLTTWKPDCLRWCRSGWAILAPLKFVGGDTLFGHAATATRAGQ